MVYVSEENLSNRIITKINQHITNYERNKLGDTSNLKIPEAKIFLLAFI